MRCMYSLRRMQIYRSSCGGSYVLKQTTIGDEEVDTEAKKRNKWDKRPTGSRSCIGF